jgi:hypothetical protein
MLHYMASNDYRVAKKQLSVVLDVDLIVAVKCAAVDGGVSVAEFVRGVLSAAVGVEGVGSGGDGFGVVSVGGVNGVEVSGVRPDWDAILAAGRASKVVGWRHVPSQSDLAELDPIEEIA